MQHVMSYILSYRTVLTMPDGGEVGLDWGRRGGDMMEDVPEETPILLILAGLTGGAARKRLCSL